MVIAVEAVQENRVLEPAEPLPWKGGKRVRLAISSPGSAIFKAPGSTGFKGQLQPLRTAAKLTVPAAALP
jgi:hypothetical protein